MLLRREEKAWRTTPEGVRGHIWRNGSDGDDEINRKRYKIFEALVFRKVNSSTVPAV